MANANQELNKSIYELSEIDFNDPNNIGFGDEIESDIDESEIDEKEIAESEIVSSEPNLVDSDVVVITRETLRCLECNYRGINAFKITLYYMLCTKRNTKDNQKKHKTNLNMNAICAKTWALSVSLIVQLL